MKQFYVYTHAKPDGSIFYVGKGHGNRAYQFSKRTVWHKNIVQKYGAANIRIQIVNCESEQAAFELEKIYIKQLRESGAELVNLTDGGDGPAGYRHTDESKKIMSEKKKGRKQSPESIEKRRQQAIGRPMPAGFGDKVRERCKGIKLSDERKKQISKLLTGKKQSNETIAKRGNANRGRRHSDSSAIFPGIIWCDKKKSWQVRMRVSGKIYNKRIKCLLDAIAFKMYLHRLHNVV